MPSLSDRPSSRQASTARRHDFRMAVSATTGSYLDFRWALGHYDQLPALAADLVRRKVTVIVATGGGVTSTRAAMAATSSIPIIFVSGGDPIDFGLVESLNKPGGNLTGVTFFLGALEAKRLELLHELLPKATLIGALVNPTFPASKTRLEDAQAAAVRGAEWVSAGWRAPPPTPHPSGDRPWLPRESGSFSCYSRENWTSGRGYYGDCTRFPFPPKI
jgi:ABC transporter substrate binding protein